jgi:hypothetical protein
LSIARPLVLDLADVVDLCLLRPPIWSISSNTDQRRFFCPRSRPAPLPLGPSSALADSLLGRSPTWASSIDSDPRARPPISLASLLGRFPAWPHRSIPIRPPADFARPCAWLSSACRSPARSLPRADRQSACVRRLLPALRPHVPRVAACANPCCMISLLPHPCCLRSISLLNPEIDLPALLQLTSV